MRFHSKQRLQTLVSAASRGLVALWLTLPMVAFSQASDSPVRGSQTLKDAQLLERFSQSSSATRPVIVQFNDLLSLKSKLGHLELSERRSAQRVLRSRQQAVLDRLTQSASEQRRAKIFQLSPQMALSVSKAELQSLLSDPSITVWEDSLKKPNLANSVSRIFSSQDSSPFDGDNFVVAVLDTGVDGNHPFLLNKLVSEACYSDGGGQPITTSLCPNGATSSTAAGSGQECGIAGCEHGTQVAGVATGNGNLFDGVARGANLISIQVYSQVNDEAFCFPNASCVGAYTSDIIAGLERVHQLRTQFNIASANVSLGSEEVFFGTCDDQPEKAIIDVLRQSNIAVVASSGNAGNSTQMQAPACISSAIAVAATFDNSDTPWVNNNISNALDLFAPGVNITSSVPGGGFSSGSGTSLAAPHVAGAWAVIRQASPNLSVNAVTNLLKSSGPVITQNTISRRRIDLGRVLRTIAPSESNVVVAPMIMLLLDD